MPWSGSSPARFPADSLGHPIPGNCALWQISIRQPWLVLVHLLSLVFSVTLTPHSGGHPTDYFVGRRLLSSQYWQKIL